VWFVQPAIISGNEPGPRQGTPLDGYPDCEGGAGREPEFGPQTGDGTVAWEHPTLGTLNFEVSILLDQFDEQGRAVGGTVVGVDAERGYEIRFLFLPDGSKEGELLRDGEVVGSMTMATDAERFTNYVDLQTEESIPLPEP